jgi:cell division septation protein DedD
MKGLRPKLIIAGSNKKKRGIGYFLTLILVFAAGVYAGTKIDDIELSRDQSAEISQDSSQKSQNISNKEPEVIQEVDNIGERGSEKEIHNISSDIINESDMTESQAADLDSEQENQNPLDGQQLQDITTSESSETKFTLKNEVSDITETGSGLPEVNVYRLQIAAFANLDDAKEAVKGLQLKGYDAYIVTTANSRGEIWNLIKVGKFETAKEAWNFSTLYQSKEGGDVFVESIQRGRVYNESLEQDNTEE